MTETYKGWFGTLFPPFSGPQTCKPLFRAPLSLVPSASRPPGRVSRRPNRPDVHDGLRLARPQFAGLGALRLHQRLHDRLGADEQRHRVFESISDEENAKLSSSRVTTGRETACQTPSDWSTLEAAPSAQEAEPRRALDRIRTLDAGMSPPKPFFCASLEGW